MKIDVRDKPFDPWYEMQQFEKNGMFQSGSYGACASFVGTMRDFNQGDTVHSMRLEHYPGMTEKLLSEYAQVMVAQYDLVNLLVIHRVGEILPNAPIVLVATWSAHRAQAFDSCRSMMEYLKAKATFWKKEIMSGADAETEKSRWVGIETEG